MNRGTPKTLDDVLKVILETSPVWDTQNFGYLVLRDFLAQRFGAAMLEHPEAEKALNELFENITRRTV